MNYKLFPVFMLCLLPGCTEQPLPLKAKVPSNQRPPSSKVDTLTRDDSGQGERVVASSSATRADALDVIRQIEDGLIWGTASLNVLVDRESRKVDVIIQIDISDESLRICVTQAEMALVWTPGYLTIDLVDDLALPISQRPNVSMFTADGMYVTRSGVSTNVKWESATRALITVPIVDGQLVDKVLNGSNIVVRPMGPPQSPNPHMLRGLAFRWK